MQKKDKNKPDSFFVMLHINAVYYFFCNKNYYYAENS